MSKGDNILIDFKQKNTVYIIAQGFVKLSKVFTNNNILVLGILTENDLINMTHAKSNSKYYYYLAEALSSTLIISYNCRRILQRPHCYSLIYNELLFAHQRHINRNNDIIQILSHRDKKSRLANLLLILCQQVGIITQFGIIINLIITHNTLAMIVGSSRTTITNTLNSLQRHQLISIYKNKLLIHDPISLSLYYKTDNN